MNPVMLASLVMGFMIGLVLALVLFKIAWGQKLLSGRASRESSAETWASLLHQALREIKTRQGEADSQRKEAEDRASQAELLYRIILESVPNAVATFDDSGKLVTANPSARELLGAEGSTAPPVFAKPLETALKGQTPPYLEIDLQTKERILPFGVRISPLRSAGSIAGAVVVLVELLELKKLQTRARLMEELADLGQMAAGMAHEFRNATGVLRTSAQYLLSRVDGEAAEAVQDLLKETEKLSRVTTDLLDFARPGESDLHLVELDTIAEEVVDQLQEIYPETRFVTDLSCPDKTVFGRSSLLARVVDNLLRNAVEADDDGSSLIMVQSEEVVNKDGPNVRFLVLDRGRGLGTVDVEGLFLPFKSTKPDGTGMGLAFARKIARLHGGDVTLKHREGGGVVAELTLPLSSGMIVH